MKAGALGTGLSHLLVTSDSNRKMSANIEYNFDLFARFIASDKSTKNRGPAKFRRLAKSAIQAICETQHILERMLKRELGTRKYWKILFRTLWNRIE
jgi:hypothetical protein